MSEGKSKHDYRNEISVLAGMVNVMIQYVRLGTVPPENILREFEKIVDKITSE